MQTLAVLDNLIRISKRSLRPEILESLKHQLTRENPEYHQKLAISANHPGMQYALPPRYIESYSEDKHTFYIPRGVSNLLHDLINKYSDQLTIIDKRIYFDRNERFALKPKIQLTDYQAIGLSHMVLNGQGVFCAPCGGGKTVTGLAVAATLAQPTLIIVHTIDLQNQWVKELHDKSVFPEEIGIVGGGQRVTKFITIATIQTLHSINTHAAYGENALQNILKNFGTIILDECHHVPANTFLDVFNLCPAKYRFGLTATPLRKDGKQFLMTDVIGPVLHEVTDDDLMDAGRSQQVIVNQIPTEFYSPLSVINDWPQLITSISEDSKRNRLIVDNIIKRWNEGHFPLILSDRVTHCRDIKAALRARGMNAEVLLGEVSKGNRSKIMLNANSNQLDAIVATSVADEGLDIPRLSNVHLTMPTNNKSKIKQRVGRIRRPIEGKIAIVDDYVDELHEHLLRWSHNRMAMYKSWNFKMTQSIQLFQ